MIPYSGRAGTRVRLTLSGGTTTVEGDTNRDAGIGGSWPIYGVGNIDPSYVRSVEYLAHPRPDDNLGNGTVLYAENNGYHHVWIKSGGAWYTANRIGRVLWSAILDKCDQWGMTLIVHGPLTCTRVYTPGR